MTVTANVVTKSFIEHMSTDIQTIHKSKLHLSEHMKKRRESDEISIRRFFNHQVNSNGDDTISVYEVNANTWLKWQKESPTRNEPNQDAMKILLSEAAYNDEIFYRNITFRPLEPSRNVLNQVEKAKPLVPSLNGNRVTVKPFDRLLIYANFPSFDSSSYLYDCLTLLKYTQNDPALYYEKMKKDPEFVFEELTTARAYVNEEASLRVYGKANLDAWNAPVNFKTAAGKAPKNTDDVSTTIFSFQNVNIRGNPISFRAKKNFQKLLFSYDEFGSIKKFYDSDDADPSTLNGPVTNMMQMLYTPVVTEPGFYTVRYCTDNVVVTDKEWAELTRTEIERHFSHSEKR